MIFTLVIKTLFVVYLKHSIFWPSADVKWKRINHKQIARWQQLKASAFLFEIFLLGVKKYNNLYFRLVTPSRGDRAALMSSACWHYILVVSVSGYCQFKSSLPPSGLNSNNGLAYISQFGQILDNT